MTSPFSIYILIGLTYPDYKAEPFAAYIDYGSGFCLSKPDSFPAEYHIYLPAIQGKYISNQNIILTKGIKHPCILIDKYIVKLPLLYFHNTGCDILLGNNFLQLFKIIIQNNISYNLCETSRKSNFLKKGKIVISVKIENFSRSRMTKRTSPLESSREI